MRTVILGGGEVGLHLCHELGRSGMEVVLVDRDPGALNLAEERIDAMTVAGDVTHWSTLKRVEVDRAGLVVAVTASDETNLVAAGIAAQCGARRTVARADARGLYRSMAAVETSVLGISFLLCASRLLAHDLLRMLHARSAEYVGDFAAHAVRACLVELDDESSIIGQPAAGASSQVVGLVRDGVLRPAADIARVEPGDRLLLAGEPVAVATAQYQLLRLYRKRRVVLIGGGDVGSQLARQLVNTERSVQVIEHDPERCRVLSEELPKVTVIQGDGTSIALLRDQRVDSADAVVASTRSDDANLMASLLARDLGVPHTFAIVHRHGYADVYSHLGVSGTIGPHDAIAHMVRTLLPRDGVLQRQNLPDCSHELVEHQLDGHLPSGLAVEDLQLPPACILLALARGHRFVELEPRLALEPNDHLVIAQPAHARKDVMKRLSKLARSKA